MLLPDIRYALRALWHSKGFATVAILCLGFGIGLNTTIYSILDGVLLKPFPYTEPDRIVVLGEQNQKIGVGNTGVSYLDLRDWRQASTSFTAVAAEQGRSLTISDGGEPQRYSGGAITWNLFPLLGISPVVGRGFTAADDAAGGEGVALLSYDLWTERYHADRGVVGRQVLVNAAPATIVGVMPPRFNFPNNQKLWIPVTPLVWKDARDQRGLFAFGRLKPGVTFDQARTELSAIAGRLAGRYPDTNRDWDVHLRTLREAFIPSDVTLVIWLMMAGVTLVLLIACSNVANLLLARASGRQREIAVRTAIGAARGRIVRQLVTESVVLSLVSVPLGILLAEVGTRLIAADMPADQVPYYIHWEMDWQSLTYAVVVAVVTAVLFGLLPALQTTRGNLHESLKEGTRGNSARRSLLRSTLVVVQVSLALVSLVGALLFVRTFSNLDTYNFGFDPTPLMSMRFYLPGAPYERPDAKLQRVHDIVDRVEALPGVEAAFSSNFVPLSGGGGGGAVVIEGRPAPEGEHAQITFIGVTPDFCKTMGVALLRGRDFTSAEGYSRSPVALVSEAMAKQFWPDVDPIGHRFHMAAADETSDWFTVIGLVRDLKLYGVDPSNNQPRPVAFVPYAYQQTLNTGLTVRVAGDPTAVTAAVRSQLRASDPNLPMFQAMSVDRLRSLSYWQYGLYGWIFGTIGVVGLLLAAVGVYGVLSYSVAQRTQEIGVRVALGAGRRDVFRLVVGHGLLLAGIGVGVGLVLAAVLMPAARSLLYAVSPFDPLTFAAVSIFLVAVSLLASYLPGLRATRVDPVVALRGE
jgi:putative ABC transport system permease protein